MLFLNPSETDSVWTPIPAPRKVSPGEAVPHTLAQVAPSLQSFGRPIHNLSLIHIYGTSAIMLSGETAAGKYPIQALKTMSTIAERTEQDIDLSLIHI